jgi:hypothetical protein
VPCCFTHGFHTLRLDCCFAISLLSHLAPWLLLRYLIAFTPCTLIVASLFHCLCHCLVASVVASQPQCFDRSLATSLHYSLPTFIPFCHLTSLPTSHPL